MVMSASTYPSATAPRAVASVNSSVGTSTGEKGILGRIHDSALWAKWPDAAGRAKRPGDLYSGVNWPLFAPWAIRPGAVEWAKRNGRYGPTRLAEQRGPAT